MHGFRLFGNIHHVRHAGLHLVSQFVGGNARGDFRITQYIEAHLIQVAHGIERLATSFRAHAFGIRDKQNRVALRPQLHALMHRRQKSTAPGVVRERLPRAGGHHDECGQILVFAAESVAEP